MKFDDKSASRRRKKKARFLRIRLFWHKYFETIDAGEVLDAFRGQEWLTLDEVAERTGFSTRVERTLRDLENKGYIRKSKNGWRRL